MYKVLIVEDSAEAFELAKRSLGVSMQIEWAKSLSEASRALDGKAFDLILLDVGLPDGDGYHLCSLLQAHHELKSVPVIFLTARNTTSDKILGFSVGADDFIAKPYDSTELRARVEAKLRRRDRDRAQARLVRVGDLEINKDTQRVDVVTSGSSMELELTPIEFKLLLMLANRPNRVFTRDELLNEVWGENVHVYSRSVDTHVSKIRKKLGAQANYIESVHGSGYRFAVEDPAAHEVDRFPEAQLSSGR